MKAFIVTGCSARSDPKTRVVDIQCTNFGLVVTESKEKAMGLALEKLERQRPSSDGWNNKIFTSDEVSRERLMEILGQIK